MSFLVGKLAPEIKATAVMPDGVIKNNFSLRDYIAGKKCVLFFYPCDFTFICPSEIIAFDCRINDFLTRNTLVVGVSTDSEHSHVVYRNISIEDGGIGRIRYPIVSDITKDISRNYDVLYEQSFALRGTFLIDDSFIIRHVLVNDLFLGRDIDEVLRVIDALSHYNKYGDVCPANWKKGQEAMTPSYSGVKDYFSKNKSKFKDGK